MYRHPEQTAGAIEKGVEISESVFGKHTRGLEVYRSQTCIPENAGSRKGNPLLLVGSDFVSAWSGDPDKYFDVIAVRRLYLIVKISMYTKGIAVADL
jgi:hypothetical protein